jgi:hypothetical protein
MRRRDVVWGLAALLVGLAAQSVWAQPGQWGQDQNKALVTVLNGLDADDVPGGVAPGNPIDLSVDGVPEITGLTYGRGATLKLEAGDYLFEADEADAANPGEGNLLASLDPGTIEAGRDYTLLLSVDADGNPSLRLFENDLSVVERKFARLVVRHRASVPTFPLVNVNADYTAKWREDVLFEGLAFDDEVSDSEMESGTLTLTVRDPDTDDVLVGPERLAMRPRVAYFVYVLGTELNDTLDILIERRVLPRR